MARKAKYDWGKSRDGRYQKFETRVTTKFLATAGSSPYADSAYIDIAQCLSMINRKLVRQGHVFKVKNMSIYSKDSSPVKTWKVGALPRTWVMFNAYKKARSLWLAQAAEAFQNVGEGNLPKYLDFKVFMDEGHYDNFIAGTDILVPHDFDQNASPTGSMDWDYSSLHDNSSTSDAYHLHMLGGHKTGSGWQNASTIDAFLSAGVIFGYEESRGYKNINTDSTDNVQQAANDLRWGPFGRLTARGSDQISDIIGEHTNDNDRPPYDFEDYPGGPLNLPEATQIATGKVAELALGSQANRVPTFEAPLGLVRIELDAASEMSSEEVEISFDTEIMGTI